MASGAMKPIWALPRPRHARRGGEQPPARRVHRGLAAADAAAAGRRWPKRLDDVRQPSMRGNRSTTDAGHGAPARCTVRPGRGAGAGPAKSSGSAGRADAPPPPGPELAAAGVPRGRDCCGAGLLRCHAVDQFYGRRRRRVAGHPASCSTGPTCSATSTVLGARDPLPIVPVAIAGRDGARVPAGRPRPQLPATAVIRGGCNERSLSEIGAAHRGQCSGSAVSRVTPSIADRRGPLRRGRHRTAAVRPDQQLEDHDHAAVGHQPSSRPPAVCSRATATWPLSPRWARWWMPSGHDPGATRRAIVSSVAGW